MSNLSCMMIAAAAGPLTPNVSIFMIMALFVFLAVVLNFVLFRPLVRSLTLRAESTEGLRQAAKDLDQESEALEADYAAKMDEARDRSAKAHNTIREEGERVSEEILTGARKEALATIEEGRARASKLVQTAQGELKKKAQGLSQILAEQVVGRKF